MPGLKKNKQFILVITEIIKEFENGISHKNNQPEFLLKYISLTNLI